MVPWADGLWLDAEDSLSAVTDGVLGRPAPPHGSQWLRVAVVRFPRISNATDAEALACEPGVAVRYVTEPSRVEGSDLVVLPGSKATVADLAWLRRTGLADAVVAHAKAGRPVLGICGGYQMLGRVIADPYGVEGGTGRRAGAARPGGRVRGGQGAGEPGRDGLGAPGARLRDPPRARGAVRRRRRCIERPRAPDAGVVLGTHWHGLLENDGFRRALLARVAEQAGRAGFRAAPDTSFAAERAAQLDLLGDLVAQHLDTAAVRNVIGHGAPAGLPTVTSGLAGST